MVITRTLKSGTGSIMLKVTDGLGLTSTVTQTVTVP
jgi:hypothetical protein